MTEIRQSQVRCNRVTWDGRSGQDAYHPPCQGPIARPKLYHCATRGCFWLIYPVPGQRAVSGATPGPVPILEQRGLDL